MKDLKEWLRIVVLHKLYSVENIKVYKNMEVINLTVSKDGKIGCFFRNIKMRNRTCKISIGIFDEVK